MTMKHKASRLKTKEIIDVTSVIYSQEHWQLLNLKRDIAKTLMEKYSKYNIETILYGSLCRGDVSSRSDIDLFIPYQISSFIVENVLNQEHLAIFTKKIVQATPKHVIKAHIYINEITCITFPLTSIREREFDFIHFGGSLTYNELKKNLRVSGVDKRLILIEPTNEGHRESSVIGYESIVAKKVGVNVELVKERVRILTTRDKIGRTGVYLNVELSPEENIDEIFKEIVDKDPVVRRRTKL